MRHLRRLWKHLGWIGLAEAAALGVRRMVPVEALRGVNEVGGNFLQTFGGIYGVIVAFTMYVVWQQHVETQLAIEREATALLELWSVFGHFGSLVGGDAARDRLRQYAVVVPRLNARVPQPCDRDDRALLTQTIEELYRFAPATPQEERLFPAALDLFHELNEAREHRRTLSHLRLPEALRWFVYIGGAISVGTLWLLYVESIAAQLLLVGGMTWIIVGLISIIIDLDDPFSGDFVVDWKRFTDAVAVMERSVLHVVPPERDEASSS